MRYITAMRNYLIETWGAGDAIDGSLELLLNHLSNKGFGEGGKGKLRDYLLRSTRAAVATYHSKNDSVSPPPVEQMQVVDQRWIRNWRDCLLERVWRSLERYQHKHPECHEYTVLKALTSHPSDTAAGLTARLGIDMEQSELKRVIADGRRRFAQLLADEVAGTLEGPDSQAVEAELTDLGLFKLVAPFRDSTEMLDTID